VCKFLKKRPNTNKTKHINIHRVTDDAENQIRVYIGGWVEANLHLIPSWLDMAQFQSEKRLLMQIE